MSDIGHRNGLFNCYLFCRLLRLKQNFKLELMDL